MKLTKEQIQTLEKYSIEIKEEDRYYLYKIIFSFLND